MRPIAEATARITGQTCSRKYIALGRIVNSWPEIVGPELAAKAQPSKLRYGGGDKKSKTPSAVLEISTSSADATLLHYQKDLILERINQLFGAGWITGIRFVADAANSTKSMGRKTKKASAPPLTPDEKNHLSEILGGIADEEMRALLANFGAAVLRDKSNQTKQTEF